MNKFITEIRRRNVFKAAISYIVMSFAVLEAADILVSRFDIGDNLIRWLFITLLIGFPIWVIFAYVYELTPTGFKKTDGVAPEASIHRATGKRLNVFIISVLTLAVVLLLFDRIFNLAGLNDASMEINRSIAVLPFKNMSVEEDAYFASGITEDILTQITKIGDLRVLSRFTLKEYDASGKTVNEIGEELNVGHLLVGSIRRSGDDLRIACQLIDTRSETEIWAHNFDRKMANVFSIQSEIAEEISKFLKVELTTSEKSNISLIPTKNLTAYNIYLKAREYFGKYDPDDNEKSIRYYKQALELDPDFGLAWSGLASSYGYAAQRWGTRPIAYLDTAVILAQRAVNLAPESASTWNNLGNAYSRRGNYDKSKEMYFKAQEINPNYPGFGQLAYILLEEGKLDEAVFLFQKAISLEPLTAPHHFNIADIYYTMGLFAKAKYHMEICVELLPHTFTIYGNLVEMSLFKGDRDQSLIYLEQMLAVDSLNAKNLEVTAGFLVQYFDVNRGREMLMKSMNASQYDKKTNFRIPVNLGYVLMQEGDQNSANEILNESLDYFLGEIEIGNKSYDYILEIAKIYSIQGDKPNTIKWLRQLFDSGFCRYQLIQLSIIFDDFQDDPEFNALINEMATKVSVMRENVLAAEDEKARRLQSI